MYYKSIITFCLLGVLFTAQGQDYRWQQRAEYSMDVKLDVSTHKVKGTQKLVYNNNSKDTLTKVYYHLFFNAFQPGSMMDVRSRNITDPDARVGDRISKLSESEIGYQHIESLKQDGKDITWNIEGTVMEVTLAKPLLPNSKTTFDMKFEAQVPVQIRRSGRNSKEDIAYSMTQWYPKLAEYDFKGWHAYQYVAREFQGVWGDFDVKITIDPKFVIGGTGVLQNADKIGHGYESAGSKVSRPSGDLTWHFVAKNVIDFAFAADPEYVHETAQVPNGPMLHFFYQPGEKTTNNWRELKNYSVKHFEFMNKTFGKYPYETYSIIQGGDGGMEYPMCTLITGERSIGSLVGVMAHEVSHSWYQGVLASNEALYPWMDEGFTDFSSNESMTAMFNQDKNKAHDGSYRGYFALVNSGLQEPISQHSDHYNTNRAYGTAAYSMGTVFLHQLKYVMGEEVFYKAMRRYYNTWKFKHPEPNDFIRVMEKTSGLHLSWYMNYWVNTTKRIDYGIKSVIEKEGSTLVTLERLGDFPMPIDLVVTYKDGSKEMLYIPLNELLGKKINENTGIARTDLEAWPWVYPTYTAKLSKKASEIDTIEIDPSMRMADVDKKNNKVEVSKLKSFEDPTR
ncbi:peptidase M1 [Chryseotalea sanaruensis]|uniref:Peptidase M1 n=1 Tax=Chryseotalea sanaruensis TaxID=2482724 RepID=A0A401U4L4_9BACT|nr:M1 family metallopeptidase [Chryseotalea sanaruensis]GCC49914.1 peptidase M1 [Chryseotalea sanaruensis]